MNNNNKDNSYKHILKFTSLFGGIQLLTIIAGLVKNKIVAVILGPSGMGLISLFNSSLSFMSNLTGLGLSTSAVRNLSEAFDRGDTTLLEREITTVRSWGFIAALFGTALCAALSGVLNNLTFTCGNHTIHFLALSPIVGMTAITGCELAILKATRRLRSLAIVSVYSVLATVIVTTPIYYLWGMSGVVPSLLVAALIQMFITISFSWHCHHPKLSFKQEILTNAFPMLRLGLAFIIAGVLSSGAEFAIRSFLNNTATLNVVGLYSAGYMIVVTYGGMIFSAMETDYYPRLSAAAGKPDFNAVVNRQCEVSLLLISPMLTAFIFMVPLLLPLLFSGRFTAVCGMVQVALLALYVRAVKLPVAYVSLACGDSLLFLSVETFYAVMITTAAIAGFTLHGLTGIGFAIVAVGFLEYIVLLLSIGHKYGYKPSTTLQRIMLLQLPIGITAYILTLTTDGLAYCLIGTLLTLFSFIVSIYFFLNKDKRQAS